MKGELKTVVIKRFLGARHLKQKTTLVVLSVAVALLLPVLSANHVSAQAPSRILGLSSHQQYLSQGLTDRSNVHVNVANGNLILETQEFNIRGTGPALNVTRFYNSRDYYNTASNAPGRQVGRNTNLSIGGDVRIDVSSTDKRFYDASGAAISLATGSNGELYPSSAYSNIKVETLAGGGWKVSYVKSGEYYLFNASGKQIKHANTDGQSITYTYSADGTLSTATDTQGRVMTFSNYSGTTASGRNVGKITDSSGRSVTYTYATINSPTISAKVLSSATDIAGNIWQYQYDATGNLTQITDPSGYITYIAYDSERRVTSITYKANGFMSEATWNYVYDNNSKTIVTDPLQHETSYFYDAEGHITSTINPVGSNNRATWDLNSNQTMAINPSNHATIMTYDALNNMTSLQKPKLANGKPGATTKYAYNDAAHPHRPTTKTDAQGNIISYSYNTNGNLLTTTNSAAGGTGMGTAKYQIQGDPNGSGGTIACGAKTGQVCAVIDAKGIKTAYSYDSKGNLLKVTPPGPLGPKIYTYDSLSRPITFTDGNNSKVTITYDAMDRPTSMVYVSGGAITYQYDKSGNMTSRTDGVGQTQWVYDGQNRVVIVKQSGQPNIGYAYDRAGNLRLEEGYAGNTTYSYDAANQISSLDLAGDGGRQTFEFTDGRPTKVLLPGGIIQTMAYDQAGRQTSIKAVRGTEVLTNYSATYVGSNGEDTELMRTETDHLTGITTKYAYDGLNRLTSVDGTGTGAHDFTYTYDINGNRTKYSHNGIVSALFGYNAANQLVTKDGAQYGAYDAAGNQLMIGTGMTLTYNNMGQTISMTPTGGTTYRAAYLDGGQTGRTQLGNKTFQNGLLGLYSDTVSGTSTYFMHLPSGTGQTVGHTKGGTPYHYLTDLRGSVVKAVNDAGVVQSTYNYDPYGNTLASSGSVKTPIRYAGGYFDTETGLYKFGARYYDPVDARWTQMDPSGQDKGYLYARNDPINFSDPTGYCSDMFGAGIAGGAQGLTEAAAQTAMAAGLLGAGGAAAAGAVGGAAGAIATAGSAFLYGYIEGGISCWTN